VGSRHTKIVLFTGSELVADAAEPNILPTYPTLPEPPPIRTPKPGDTIKLRI
jgi:hypothetical protein